MKNTIYIATEIHAHEALAALTEYGTVDHAHLCLADKEFNHLVVWHAQPACIKDDKIGCLRTYHAQHWHICLEVILHVVDIGIYSFGVPLHEALFTLKSVYAPCHRNNAQELCHFWVWTDGDRRDCNNRLHAWNHHL